jgi:tetratricopeptide (TPR) repeat protein
MAASKGEKTSLEDALKKFEQAIKEIHSSNYKKALKLLTEIKETEIDRPELIEKVRNLSRICQRKLDKVDGKVPAKSPEIIYDYGVFCYNNGDFEEALEHFKKSLEAAGEKLDYVYYAMAATHAAQGQNDDALSLLKVAIELNETCRIYAANDPDFSKLADDGQFRKLLDLA